MAAPIVLRGEVIGALQVGDVSRARVWRDQDLAFIQAVADQVALAVENARLIEQTQRVARREKAIAEAADRIHRPVDLDTILRTAIEEVVRITGSTEVSIQLGVGAGTAKPALSEVEGSPTLNESTDRNSGSGEFSGLNSRMGETHMVKGEGEWAPSEAGAGVERPRGNGNADEPNLTDSVRPGGSPKPSSEQERDNDDA
jgi:hypothetical protein